MRPTGKFAARDLGFLPVRARKKGLTAIIDRKTGEVVKVLSIDPGLDSAVFGAQGCAQPMGGIAHGQVTAEQISAGCETLH